MTGSPLFERYSVLLLEQSQIHLDLFESWLPDVKTKCASTPEDLHARFDSSVAVVIFSRESLGEEEKKTRNHVLNWNPYCQLVPILPRSSSIALNNQHYDACLERPVSKEELRTTVEKRMKYGVYSALLHEFYHLNTELISCQQAEFSEGDEDDSNVDVIKKRIRHVETRLNLLQQSIDVEDSKELFRSQSLHNQLLTEPTDDIDPTSTSKYHPDKCQDCRLPWGVDHGNELGEGFTTIGAHVLKCTRCDEVTHGSGPGDRRIARR